MLPLNPRGARLEYLAYWVFKCYDTRIMGALEQAQQRLLWPCLIATATTRQQLWLLACIGVRLIHNFYLNEKRNLNFYGVPQLNWEKCYFMVKVGIVLGHKVSSAGLEVAKAKTEVITKLPPQTNVKGIRNTKGNLTNAPIMVSPEWSLPFELMCDASSFAVGAVLGQREGKHFRAIYFARKTLICTQ
ncbi:reverse transcriptase domain-containing protein [Tanacetum coccineum]